SAGSYAFQATYNGDSNNSPSTGACEPLTVNTKSTTTANEIHKNADHAVIANGTALDLGSSVHDKATVSGAIAGVPLTGNVTFSFFSGGNCTTGTSAGAGTVTVVSGVAHPSDAETNLAAGRYDLQAHFNGDANYGESTSACEPFSVNTKSTTTATEIHNNADHAVIANGTALDLGSSVHDKATVSGAIAGVPLTGNVTFSFFSGGNCTTGTSAGAGTVTVVSGVAHPSDAETNLAAGSYAFQAHYNGDANYGESTSACEPFSVNKKQLTVGTKIHDANHNVIADGSAVPLTNNVVHDTAQVGDKVTGFSIGAVTFTFYSGGNCATGTPALIATAAP